MLLGEGKWKFRVDTMFYRGDVDVMVGSNDGGYDIDIKLTDMEIPSPSYERITVEGNILTGVAHTDLLKGKDIPFSFTIEGDTASGYLKVPFMGKIKLNDGHRVG